MSLKFVNKEDVSTLPQVLYKYRTWNNADHKRLLTHGEIYYAAPDEFQELTECNLQPDYAAVNDSMIWEFCRQEAQRQVDRGDIPVPYVLNRAKELYANHSFYDLEHRKRAEEEFRIYLNETLSIFCASKTPINERLWNAFAGFKEGYCVGIDFTEIYGNDKIFGACGPVDYYDETKAPTRIPISLSNDDRVLSMMELIYSLPKKFQDEGEFRLSKMHMQNRRVTLNPAWIKEVILGSGMSPASQTEVMALVKEKYPNAALKKLFVEPTFETLSIIEL
jgi:hypothetical protein